MHSPEPGGRRSDALGDIPSLSVAVLSRHPVIRNGLTSTLTACGVEIVATAPDAETLAAAGPALSAAHLLVGPLADIAELEHTGHELQRPVLGIALQRSELNATTDSRLWDSNLLLLEAQQDVAQLCDALQTVAAGNRLLAVSPDVLARWVPPPEGLRPREWELMIARLLTKDRVEAARACGLKLDTAKTYEKRARQALAPRSQSQLLALVRARLLEQLGVLPQLVQPAPSSIGQ